MTGILSAASIALFALGLILTVKGFRMDGGAGGHSWGFVFFGMIAMVVGGGGIIAFLGEFSG